MTEIHMLSLEDASALKINRNEALRYMGVKEADESTLEMLAKCEEEAKKYAEPRAVYLETPITLKDSEIDFGFMKVKSRNLAKNLEGCSDAHVFVATIGLGVERQFKRISAKSQAKAMVYSATCSALVESFCDYVNSELARGKETKPRFSCGYGDFCLEHQADILKATEATKRLGVYLTDSYMMVPVKTVTAIIGIRR